MASNSDDDGVFRPTDEASIGLLRRLRAGEHVHFVHHVDVCDAVPEVLVADLEPVPGTGVDDGGSSSVWYFYHAKKYKNSLGDTSGHRQRAVTGGGGTGWHSEISRKEVQGSGGRTFCKFSYGRKMGRSAKSIDRMGWCMVEYDFAAVDKQQDEAAAASNYVLCKVYRSPRAKEKSASASASSSSSKNASSKTAKKRKAGGDHPEAPQTKSIQQQEQVQLLLQASYQPQGMELEHGGDFNFNIEDINFYVDESMLRDEPEPGLQHQPIAEPEHDGRFIQLPCGPVFAAEATVGDMLGQGIAVQLGAEHGSKDLNMEEFTVEWLLQGEAQQPIVQPPPGHDGDGEFIQMPFGPVVPVVPESTLEDMLGFGPETMFGQGSGDITTASMPYGAVRRRTLDAAASLFKDLIASGFHI